MNKVFKALLENKTHTDHLKTFLGYTTSRDQILSLYGSNITSNIYKLSNETVNFLNQENQPKTIRNNMNFATKCFYIFSLFFIFAIGLIGIIVRVADRDGEQKIYLAYKKYHRNNSENSINVK
jgi:hypothetical protein